MKAKSALLVLGSLLASSAQAHPSEIGTELRILGESSEDVIKASIAVGSFSLEDRENTIQMSLDAPNKILRVRAPDHSKSPGLDILMNDLKNQLGSAVKIQKVKIENFSHGTQDDVIK